ncbi:tetratricopeptide repeat protein, partial [Nocardia salmonicida]
YQQTGRVDQAAEQFEQLLTDHRRVLGDDHPNTLTNLIYLANVYRSVGLVVEAIPLYECALTDSERVLGLDHPTTNSLRRNLAHAHAARRSSQ